MQEHSILEYICRFKPLYKMKKINTIKTAKLVALAVALTFGMSSCSKNVAYNHKTIPATQEMAKVEMNSATQVATVAQNHQVSSTQDALNLNGSKTLNFTRNVIPSAAKSIVSKVVGTSAIAQVQKQAIIQKSPVKSNKSEGEPSKGLYTVLCIIAPCIAVGIKTDWDWKQVIITFLLTCLCIVPGIIKAFKVING